MSTPQYGKGDAYRPVDKKKWSENYDRIFKRKRAKRRARGR